MSQPKPSSTLARILKQSAPSIIELGSGTGVAGLELARLCPTSDVLLTDHLEATDLLQSNLSKAKSASKEEGTVATRELNWDNALPKEISKMYFDIIVVSDCTYNSDSIPALVRTLATLIKSSPDAYVIVSMKRRHESEAVFFDLMSDAGFTEVARTNIPLPDRQRKETGLELETVEIFIYQKEILSEGGNELL